jgi:hypothetical protein
MSLLAPVSAARADRQPARTLTLSKPALVGGEIRFAGRGRNAPRGTPVALQCEVSGRWRTLGTTRTRGARGVFGASAATGNAAGTVECRARIAGRGARPALSSGIRTVWVPVDPELCHWNKDGSAPDVYEACIRTQCSVSELNYFACGDKVGEFDDPSWTALPAPSVYNTTPACPITVEDPYCDVPLLDAPPPDPGNGEWLRRMQNADGTWSQNATGYVNSAYWPSEKRPDLEIYAIPKAAKDCADRLWHYCYLSGAEAVGYPIGHTPAVGDLAVFSGECQIAAGSDDAAESSACNPPTNMDWYAWYVEQVNPDGTWIGSDAGSCIPACHYGPDNADRAYDSGISLGLFAPAMDADTDFIGLMPAGSPKP